MAKPIHSNDRRQEPLRPAGLTSDALERRLLELQKPDDPRPALKALSELPMVDRLLIDSPMDYSAAVDVLIDRIKSYAKDEAGFLSPMERQIVQLQVDDPFNWDGSAVRDYSKTLNIFKSNEKGSSSNKNRPRFQLCNYLHPKLIDLDNFFSKYKKAVAGPGVVQAYEKDLLMKMKGLMTGKGSFELSPERQAKHLSFLQESIAALKEAAEPDESGSANDPDGFKIAKLTIENYYYYHILPKELHEFGLVLGPSLCVNSKERQRYIGAIHPKLSEEILNKLNTKATIDEFGLPVYLFSSANATHANAIAQVASTAETTMVNLASLERELAAETVSAHTWKKRFDKLLPDNLRFEQDPRFIDQFLLLGFHGGEPNPDASRNAILDFNLGEEIAYNLSKIYLESLYRQDLHEGKEEKLDFEKELFFWTELAHGRRQQMSHIFKETKSTAIVHDAYEQIEKAMGTEQDITIDSLDAMSTKRGVNQTLRIEARLRALAKANNPLYGLVKSLQQVVIPMTQEKPVGYTPASIKEKPFKYSAEIVLTRLLTEKLLGEEGKQLVETVKWDELLKMSFDDSSFQAYQHFLENPSDPSRDPLGLMRLRRVWYKFFDKYASADYDKQLSGLSKSRLIQDAAKSLVKREFTSYQDRKMKDHVEYYKRNLGLGEAVKLNDMAV